MAGPKSDLITVSVPPESGSVQVLRAVTASVAARMNMPFDGIEDLRLAVDEACAQLLSARGSAITVEIAPSGEGVETLCSTDADVAVWQVEGAGAAEIAEHQRYWRKH